MSAGGRAALPERLASEYGALRDADTLQLVATCDGRHMMLEDEDDLAAEIARRWNAHAGLVAALRDIADLGDGGNPYAARIARAALDAAKAVES